MQNWVERIARFPHLRVQPFTDKMFTLKPISDFTDYEKVWKSGVKAPEWQGAPAYCPRSFQWLLYRIVHQVVGPPVSLPQAEQLVWKRWETSG